MNGFFAQRHTPPFRHFLPGTAASMIADETPAQKIKGSWRVMKRHLTMIATGQAGKMRDRIPPAPARILWLNPSSTSIGDSIMELAGRSLLSGYTVDLFTDEWNAGLYAHDRFFRRVMTAPGEFDPANYDFALLDLLNTRSLRFKSRHCASLPFATMQGHFYGADFNRMLFSAYRIHHLLGYPHDEETLKPHLRHRLFTEGKKSGEKPSAKKRVALAVGGVRATRTYKKWPEVLDLLFADGRRDVEILLLGSENGKTEAALIEARFPGERVTNLVGKLTLAESVATIAGCDLFLGADGGLMHVAVAFEIPGVAIFGFFRPEFRLPSPCSMRALFVPNDVNECAPEDIAANVTALLRSPGTPTAVITHPTIRTP